MGEIAELYSSNSGQYTGPNALAAFNAEFGKSQSFIQVELDGGGGTANGHWNESPNNPGDTQPGDNEPAPVVVSGPNAGKSLNDELMTGSLSGDAWLSETTKGSLMDIGYMVVPEPSSLMMAAGGLALALRRRRH